MANKMDRTFRLLDFNVYNTKPEKIIDSSDEEDGENKKGSNQFTIQMFGINEEGQKASIIVEEYQPFFYVKVPNCWGQKMKTAFQDHLKAKVGKYYENSITECKLIEKKKNSR